MPVTGFFPSLESKGERPAMVNQTDWEAYTAAITALLALIQRYIDAIGFHDGCRCSVEHCPDVESMTVTLSGFEDCIRVAAGLGKFLNLPWSNFNGEKTLNRTDTNQWRFDDSFTLPIYSDSDCTVLDGGEVTFPVYITCNCYDGDGFGFTIGTEASDNPDIWSAYGGAIWQSDTPLPGPVFPNTSTPFDACPSAGCSGAAIITMETGFDSGDFDDLVAAVNALAPVGVPAIFWMRDLKKPKAKPLYTP